MQELNELKDGMDFMICIMDLITTHLMNRKKY